MVGHVYRSIMETIPVYVMLDTIIRPSVTTLTNAEVILFVETMAHVLIQKAHSTVSAVKVTMENTVTKT